MPEQKPLSLQSLGERDGALLVRAAGCISESGGPGVSLEDLLGADCYTRSVLVDLNYVDFIDSSGIGWLLGQNRRFQAAGGKLVLHSIPPVVRHTLKVLRMESVFRLAKDESAACSLARGEAPV